jgi:hypothetical protein
MEVVIASICGFSIGCFCISLLYKGRDALAEKTHQEAEDYYAKANELYELATLKNEEAKKASEHAEKQYKKTTEAFCEQIIAQAFYLPKN